MLFNQPILTNNEEKGYMKRNKLYIFLALMMVFMLALAACGGSDEETPTEEPTTEAAPTEEVVMKSRWKMKLPRQMRQWRKTK